MSGAMNLTPDQAGKFFDLKEKFRNDTAAVRKQMMVKHAELAALWKAEKPDQAAITPSRKKSTPSGTRCKRKERLSRLEARKIAPELAKGFGRGMGGGVWVPAAAWVLAAVPCVGPGGGPAPGAPAK